MTALAEKKMANNKPKEKIIAGAVSCALWENELTTRDGRQIPVLKASLERRYRDASGTWKSSNSFGRNEIPQAIYCLMKAYAAMMEKSSDEEEAAE
jgi:hypothetical protein